MEEKEEYSPEEEEEFGEGEEYFTIGEDGEAIDSTPGLAEYMGDDEKAGDPTENDESTYNRFSEEDAKIEEEEAKNKVKWNDKNQKKKVLKHFSKSEAIKYACHSTAEGYCPFCHQMSMSKSDRLGDRFWIGSASFILNSKISTFYCFNPKCKHNYRSGWCVRCAGERYIGKAFPMKRVLNVN